MLKAISQKSGKNRWVLLLFIAVVYVTGNFIMGFWKTSLFYGDSNGYYMHLVSFFINQDVGDYDKTITALRQVNPNSADPREDIFGIRLTEKGRRSIKYPLGVPLMEMPFFLIAHCYAKLSGSYASDGWSLPYRFMVGLSTIFYVLIGFHLLMKVLEKYFQPLIQVFAVLAIAFATNLFFNSTCVVMAHGFLFRMCG